MIFRICSSREETHIFGRQFSQLLQGGDCVLLSGELGAGKTTFVQGVAWGLDFPANEYVVSPSYAIAMTYHTQPYLHHLDLYRVSRDGWRFLGDSYFSSEAVTMIEWPPSPDDRWLPPEYFFAQFSVLDDERREITLSASSVHYKKRLSEWEKQF